MPLGGGFSSSGPERQLRENLTSSRFTGSTSGWRVAVRNNFYRHIVTVKARRSRYRDVRGDCVKLSSGSASSSEFLAGWCLDLGHCPAK